MSCCSKFPYVKLIVLIRTKVNTVRRIRKQKWRRRRNKNVFKKDTGWECKYGCRNSIGCWKNGSVLIALAVLPNSHDSIPSTHNQLYKSSSTESDDHFWPPRADKTTDFQYNVPVIQVVLSKHPQQGLKLSRFLSLHLYLLYMPSSRNML